MNYKNNTLERLEVKHGVEINCLSDKDKTCYLVTKNGVSNLIYQDHGGIDETFVEKYILEFVNKLN